MPCNAFMANSWLESRDLSAAAEKRRPGASAQPIPPAQPNDAGDASTRSEGVDRAMARRSTGRITPPESWRLSTAHTRHARAVGALVPAASEYGAALPAMAA